MLDLEREFHKTDDRESLGNKEVGYRSVVPKNEVR